MSSKTLVGIDQIISKKSGISLKHHSEAHATNKDVVNKY